MNSREAAYGMAAGAAGTAVLNAGTYADMAIRSRPPDTTPEEVVKEVAHRAGVDGLSKPRTQGLGMLMGYGDGLAVGTLFGLLRPRMRGVPWYVAGAGLAALTMLVSEGTATALGKAHPRTWTATDWAAGLIPRMLYGCVTCLVYDALNDEE